MFFASACAVANLRQVSLPLTRFAKSARELPIVRDGVGLLIANTQTHTSAVCGNTKRYICHGSIEQDSTTGQKSGRVDSDRHSDSGSDSDDSGQTDRLSHVSPTTGRLRMVDVSSKTASERRAVASARVALSAEAFRLLCTDRLAKSGCAELMTTARLAGLMAAKRTASLLPLCHPLPLSHVDVQVWPCASGGGGDGDGEGGGCVRVRATVRCRAVTGVEMEALTAAAVAALTVYDTCKSAGHAGLAIEHVRLEEKSGGKSGHYRRRR